MQRIPSSHLPYMIDLPGRINVPSRASPSVEKRPKGRRLSTSNFCFLVGGLAALAGMALGMAMGITQDFTLAPAHAHLNLLGWVTMALYGLYHRSTGRTDGGLGWTQVLAGAVGAIMMSAGLAIYLHLGDDRYMPLVIVGSLLAVLGMALFVAIIVIDQSSQNASSTKDGALAA